MLIILFVETPTWLQMLIVVGIFSYSIFKIREIKKIENQYIQSWVKEIEDRKKYFYNNEGRNLFIYKPTRNNRGIIKRKIIPLLQKNNVEIVISVDKWSKPLHTNDDLNNKLTTKYRLGIETPALVKIRNGHHIYKDESIKILFKYSTNRSLSILMKTIKQFYKI